MCKPTLTLTLREYATVAAALSYWRRTRYNRVLEAYDDMATGGGIWLTLSETEIVDLCRRFARVTEGIPADELLPF